MTKTNEVTYTKGKWHIEADRENQGKHPLHDNRFIVRENGDIVCTLRDQETQVQDARLIAAAPELFEACKELVTLYVKKDGLYLHSMSEKSERDFRVALRAIESAIAKAQL